MYWYFPYGMLFDMIYSHGVEMFLQLPQEGCAPSHLPECQHIEMVTAWMIQPFAFASYIANMLEQPSLSSLV
jgi:hypothetical protein